MKPTLSATAGSAPGRASLAGPSLLSSGWRPPSYSAIRARHTRGLVTPTGAARPDPSVQHCTLPSGSLPLEPPSAVPTLRSGTAGPSPDPRPRDFPPPPSVDAPLVTAVAAWEAPPAPRPLSALSLPAKSPPRVHAAWPWLQETALLATVLLGVVVTLLRRPKAAQHCVLWCPVKRLSGRPSGCPPPPLRGVLTTGPRDQPGDWTQRQVMSMDTQVLAFLHD